MTSGWRIAAAILLGIAMFPALLIFPPFLFPWMYLVLFVLGLILGTLVPRAAPRPLVAAPAIAALSVAVAVLVLARAATSAGALPLLASSARLFVVVGAGALIAVALRRRLGPKRAFVVATAGTLVLFISGAALALALAPAQAGPDCAHVTRGSAAECQGVVSCAMIAERRRLWTVERVVEFDARTNRATCTYTAWGGILIGTARDGGWTDGPIPIFLGWP